MLKTIFLVFLYVAFTAAGNLLVGCGMRQKAVCVPYVAIGTMVLSLGYAVYLGLLKEVPLSVVVPSGAASYLLIAAMSRWALNETVPTLRWIGAIVVSIGVSIVLLSDSQLRKSAKSALPAHQAVAAPLRQSGAPGVRVTADAAAVIR